MSAPDCVVAIDDFQFGSLEVPEEIPFGGDQKLNIHRLPGGARVIDAMGRDDAPLVWSGLFLGAQALERARYLDFLRAQGLPHTVTWHEFRYTAIIRTLKCSFQRFYKLPYEITLEVVADLAQAITSFPAESPDDAINDDNDTAQALGPEVDDPTLTGQLDTLDTSIGNVSTFVGASTEIIQSVLVPLKAVQARVATLLLASTTTLLNIGMLGGGPNPALALVGKVQTEIDQSQQQQVLVQLTCVAARMAANLALVNGPANAHGITVGATTLYKVSEDEYGDATIWPTIARANGLVDPQITTLVTLTIPNQPGASGGVLTP